MLHIANTRDLQTALLDVIRNASQPNPSRYALAAELESIAEKLGARTRKKSPKVAPPSGPRVLVNIADKERVSLNVLSSYLNDALGDIDRERREIVNGISQLEDDAKMDERALAKDEVESKWVAHSFFAGQITAHFQRGLDYLADTLETNAEITREFDLAAAVKAFSKKIPEEGNWPEGKGEKHFKDVQKAITEARDKLPTGLTKRSELTKLRDALEAIVDAVKLMTGKSIPVPKIPNALDPEDPRQLGFGFAAAGPIANADELKTRLNILWRVASQPHPSRQQLGRALLHIAQGLRARA